VSNRCLNLIVLAALTGMAAGCASDAVAVQAAGGLLAGLADGFLIMFDFVGGNLADAGRQSHLHGPSSYSFGYVSGATAFFAAGTACSLP